MTKFSNFGCVLDDPSADTSVLGTLLLCARAVQSSHPRLPVATAQVYRGVLPGPTGVMTQGDEPP